MITQEEENFLKTIPVSKKVSIKPFDNKITETSEEIISKIKKAFSDLEVLHLGASGLGISGQNDIDIYALSNPKNFNKYLPELIKIFGKPLHKHEKSIEWKFKRSGFDVEFYLTDLKSPSMQRQIKIYNILKSNKKLLKEYENLKLSFNGKSFQDYQKAKYEFYNRILTTKAENGSGAIICWKDKVLLFHRDNIPTIPAPDCWHLPGGGMEKGETPLDTIKRELMEEVSHIPRTLNFLVTLKRNDGSLSHIYYSFVDDDEAVLFKIDPGEGQEIGFFTVEEMFNLKLTPMMNNYLLPLRKEIEKAMETKNFSALIPKLKAQPDEY